VLSAFGTALFRHHQGIPDQCPACGSYQIGLLLRTDEEAEAVPGCQRCGWISPFAASETQPSA
jgi:predicted RNA-binding Zn-ribbon protein involved in translation (DUF1610 family)